MTADELQTTSVEEPVNAPGRPEVPVEGRADADAVSGFNEFISWGSRSDVGLVRGHNEDSFLIRPPLFVVCDGMGGHAAGEVASSIAIETIGSLAPGSADDVLLGAAVEAANKAVIRSAEEGIGKPGMGCTASCVLVEKDRVAIAHVGDSRVYLLHQGMLVRLTHDHSYVEELVDSGQITADEARIHPSRSIITRALGSDPDMYADHFTLEVNSGDRLIVCSDGLSSMISDSEMESLAVSSATPQQAADNLVAAALTAGGGDNVTVVVVDVLDDGLAAQAKRRLFRNAALASGAILAVLAVVVAVAFAFIHSEWYLAPNDGMVAIYRGVNSEILGIPLSELVSTSAVEVADLPEAVQDQLEEGIRVESEDAAFETINSYYLQIDAEAERAAQIAQEVADATQDGTDETTSDESEGSAEDATQEDGSAEGGE